MTELPSADIISSNSEHGSHSRLMAWDISVGFYAYFLSTTTLGTLKIEGTVRDGSASLFGISVNCKSKEPKLKFEQLSFDTTSTVPKRLLRLTTFYCCRHPSPM